MKWGLNRDQTFEGTLTANFSDNSRVGNIHNANVWGLYIDYTKGSEDKMLIQIEYSSVSDIPPREEEKFFVDSYIEGIEDVKPQYLAVSSSGTYRILFGCILREDRIRVSVKGVGNLSSPGTFKLYYDIDLPSRIER